MYREAVIKKFVNRTVWKININQNQRASPALSASSTETFVVKILKLHRCIFKRTFWCELCESVLFHFHSRTNKGWKGLLYSATVSKHGKPNRAQTKTNSPIGPTRFNLLGTLSLFLFVCQCQIAVVVQSVVIAVLVVVGDDNCAGNRRHNNSATPFFF